MASNAPTEAPASSVAEGEKSYTPPPAELPSDTRRRTYIVWSYWLIVVFLGLPIWWQTTAIHRAHLPLDGMMQWADGKVHRTLVIELTCESAADLLPRRADPSSPSRLRFAPMRSKNQKRNTSCA